LRRKNQDEVGVGLIHSGLGWAEPFLAALVFGTTLKGFGFAANEFQTRAFLNC
jgi:hypothetical protein